MRGWSGSQQTTPSELEAAVRPRRVRASEDDEEEHFTLGRADAHRNTADTPEPSVEPSPRPHSAVPDTPAADYDPDTPLEG
eukprot:3340714-Alexandrium_andersonii.AAC.1